MEAILNGLGHMKTNYVIPLRIQWALSLLIKNPMILVKISIISVKSMSIPRGKKTTTENRRFIKF